MSRAALRVKLIGRIGEAIWRHQLPHGEARWGECEFVFAAEARDYDWLVVYDDLPERETLACPRAHTLLVTTEPPSVKIYGNAYTHQFGAVLTSQPEWALPHPQRLYAQPALHWFYGVGRRGIVPFDRIPDATPDKTRDVSMVYSPKAMGHTLHRRRERFMRALASGMPELEVFGRGTARPLDDKADCLRGYRYHVAVENYVGMHHWTEKLADPFLGLALPFYYGCPNADDYFPPESFIRIDIDDPDAARAALRTAVSANDYARRLPALHEARRRVLYEYNLFAVLAREIVRLHRVGARPDAAAAILSRHALRRTSPRVALADFYGKLRGRFSCAVRGVRARRS